MKKKGFVLLCVAVICLVSVVYASANNQGERTVLFEDDFSGSVLKPEWQEYGVWKFPEPGLENGRLAIAKQQQGLAVGIADPNWSDYVLEVDISAEGYVPQVSAPIYDCLQVTFRHAGGEEEASWKNFYVLVFSQKHVRLVRFSGKYGVQLITMAEFVDDVALQPGKWLRVRVELKGENIKVFVDGKLYIDFTDKEYPHLIGGAGMQSWASVPFASKWLYDNFRAYMLE